jgi:hypothetical protein
MGNNALVAMKRRMNVANGMFGIPLRMILLGAVFCFYTRAYVEGSFGWGRCAAASVVRPDRGGTPVVLNGDA